jgi:formylglycine-generating enzyme required for sulfatase activity
MISVPAGKFAMGSPESEPGRDKDEQPVHEVAIKAFAVGKLEVTFRQWDICVAEGGCKHQPGDEHWVRDDRPVLNVSWADAKEYAQWLSKKTGKPYRLLTEAEWEYAARAGSGTAFYWGAGEASACDYAVVRTDWLGCGTGRDAIAGSRKPNAFGLYDMAGNVWEWTEDCYAETYSGAPADGSARTAESCTRRTTRGGAWDVRAREARSANRNPRNATDRNYTIGFRVARDL